MDDKNTWQGRPVASESHKKLLEMSAAAHEFKHKMPKSEAEGKAYEEYVHQQHVEGAAHHLASIHAANATGDTEAGKKHWALYELHNKALGHQSVGEPHPEVKAHMEKGGLNVIKFKPHKSDIFAIYQL